MKRYVRCETESKLHIDPVSKTLVKPDIDIGGRKYDAEDQVAAIDYMYGYGSLPKARQAIVDGKYSEDDIKRAILYKETEGLPFKERKELYQKNLKKFGLYKEDESITAAVNPWKVRYEVHWISPDGKDCLLGGANDIDEVNAIAINQANDLYDNPFETPERKVEFLLNLYIVATGTEEDAMLTSTEDYIDDLIRRIRKEV